MTSGSWRGGEDGHKVQSGKCSVQERKVARSQLNERPTVKPKQRALSEADSELGGMRVIGVIALFFTKLKGSWLQMQ